MAEGKKDQPIDLEFARKWAEVIQEWSDRYGDKVAGWWFDGGYEHVRFNEAIAEVYATAVKHGNPNAIVTFNPGVRLIRHTQAEDYTAGELNDPFNRAPSLTLGGRLAVARPDLSRLAVVGVGTRGYPTEKWVEWVSTAMCQGRCRHAGHGTELGLRRPDRSARSRRRRWRRSEPFGPR